jgi:hypothetical protein
MPMETQPNFQPDQPNPSAMEATPMPPEQSPASEGTEIIEPTPSFSWEASEFVHHDKPFWWNLGLVVAALVICAILALLHQWLSVGVVVLMALAVNMYARKAPRTLMYALDSKGVSINGKLSPYSHFRSYNIQPQVGWEEIDLEPAGRFSPRLTLLADEDHFEQIETVLAHHLPRVDRDPDIIEKISRYLKF